MLRSSTTIVAMLALGVATMGLAPAGAGAATRDLASTHAYVLANYRLAQESQARTGAGQAAIVRANRKLAQECPNVGAGSPQNGESQKMSYEVVGALWSIAYGTVAGPIEAFARAVAPLRWSNPGLTRRAREYAKSLHELAVLPLPDLCRDVREWSASGYRTIPAQTVSFDAHAESIEPHVVPERLLAPYLRPADRGVVQSTMRLENKLKDTETVTGFDDWDLLLGTLGVNQ
jgi:hypothetical protein